MTKEELSRYYYLSKEIEQIQLKIDEKCVCCGKPADKYVIWGRQY